MPRPPLRLLREPIPAVARINGREVDVVVTAWRRTVLGWTAWVLLRDGTTQAVGAEDVRRR